MGIGEIVLGLRTHLANDAANEIVYLTVATDLTRQSALPAHPLAINIGIAFKAGSVPLNAWLRPDLDDV